MQVNITIPVYNEEHKLRNTVTKLCGFAGKHLPMDWEIVIANNGSTDGTLLLAEALEREHPKVKVLNIGQIGRGRALKQAWMAREADIVSYMDADLSTDLEAYPALIESLISGGYDIATGSRLLKPGLTTRSLKREYTSRCYNCVVRNVLGTRFSDAQCGFKALKFQAARELLPVVEDNGWFFDTELLVTAEKLGYRIFDLPVRWIENRDSRVRIVQTAVDDLKGLIRLRRKWKCDARASDHQGTKK